jgi:hypothetical protein
MQTYLKIKDALESIPKELGSGITIASLKTALKRGDIEYKKTSMGARARYLVTKDALIAYLKKLNSK